MSDTAAVPPATTSPSSSPPGSAGLVKNATLIGVITFVSRLLGLARESIAARAFGAGAVWSAFVFAFTIPNLFRKLLGEGALSAAFIPLYAAEVKKSGQLEVDSGQQEPSSLGHSPLATGHSQFASAAVNLLLLILLGLTIVGELVLVGIRLFTHRPDYLLAIDLTCVMLPYVMLVCGTAFLSAILQVHHRFAAATWTAVVLNVVLIVAIVLAGRLIDLTTDAGKQQAVWWLSWGVLLAGVIQIVILIPSLVAVGFRLDFRASVRTPAIRKMLLMTAPVALGLGVLQIGTLLDKVIAFGLARAPGAADLHVLGHTLPLPMAEGAAVRLNLAQYMYQFPLGVFAIALATAIFPRLSSDAVHADGTLAGAASEQFRGVLRQGVIASLFIGLPASAGMIIVREPAVRLLFQGNQFTPQDAAWVALSMAIYSAAIWAFSLLQIVNRAYYALHDATTPLVWTVINLVLNLAIELPLLWTGLGESAMAVGTLVSFGIQAIAMLWLLGRRCGGLGLREMAPTIAKMLIATAAMYAACWLVTLLPFYPHGTGRWRWAAQLAILMAVGGGVYFGACVALGMGGVMKMLKRRRRV
jgi:putative peptidoglycan lipid II flippase